MAKKASSKKSLKSLFSKSEASLDGTAEKDADRTEGDKKKFKLFKIKTKSRSGSAPEKAATQEQRARSAVESGQTADDTETWTDDMAYRDKSSLYATAPRSKDKDISYSELDLHKPKKFATLSFGLKKKKKKYEDSISQSTFALHVPQPEESNASTTPLQLSRVETGGDQFKTTRLLSISQPELDTSNAFDVPSPPPVAASRFEPGFSAINQPPPSASFDTHAGTQEPLEGLDHADVPDRAPKAPIATIPELQMGTAAFSEESVSAHENGLTPASTARTEHQTTPIGPNEQPQVDIEGAVSESAAWTMVPQNDAHQNIRSGTETSCDASAGGETSHDQTPDTGGGLDGGPHTAGVAEVGSASVPGEISAPEAVPTSAVSQKTSPRLVSQDEVYGALYDSLFPQSFTSEVLSPLSTPPPQVFTKDQQSKAVVRTEDEYRTESSTYPGQSALPAAGRGDPVDPYADRMSVSGGSRFTSYQTEADPSKGSGIHGRAPPSSLHSPFESPDGGKQSGAANCLPEGPLLQANLQADTPSTVLPIAAPPVSDYGTAPGRDARVTESVPALTRGRHVVRGQVSSRAASSASAPENKSVRNPEWKPQTPAPPADMEGFSSPTYLSVGSDDGSAVDIYYSAEEDNSESGDDEMYTMDEGGAQMGDGGTTVGNLSARDVSDTDRGKLRGMLVQKPGGEKKEDSQARGHDSKAHLLDNERFLKVMIRVEEERTELLAKPVVQGKKPAVCDSVPPSAETCGRLEDSRQIRKFEPEEPPNGEQRSLRQPLNCLARKSGEGDDARREVIISVKSARAEKQVSTVAEAEKSSEDGRHPDGHGATSTAAGTAAPLTGSMTHRGSAAEHNRVPQSAEWVDTITQSTGRSRNLEPEVQLQLTDTHRAASAPLWGSPEHPAGARPVPSRGSATTSGTAVLALGLEPDRTRKMDSGYSSLSTTLAFKNFPEDDAKRFHKLSLIRESQADGAASTAAAETNGEENKWKNRFEGVFHHKPPRGEDSSLSDAESDSSEATTCKYLDTSSSLFSLAPEPDLTPGNRLSSSREVCTGGEGEQRDEWRRSGSQWEEPAAPAEREGAALRLKSLWQQSAYDNSFKEEEDDSERFTGVFQATLVELDSDPLATPSTPPASPDSDSLYQFEMDNLVDTLKSMGPSMRPRATVPRPPAPNLMSSLPPIVEDSHSPVSLDLPDFSGAATRRESLERKPAEPLNGLYTLPADLGLRSTRDTRSLLDLMKQNQQDLSPTRGPGSPLRTTNSAMRTSLSSLPDELQSQILDGNGPFPSPSLSSRLDNSVIFGRSVTSDQKSLFRTSSLPDAPFGSERLSIGTKEFESGTRTDPGSRYERFSALLNTSTSLNGADDAATRISWAPQASMGSPPSSNSPTILLSPTGSIDLHRPFASPESTLSMFGQAQAMGIGAGRVSTPILQRSFSSEGGLGVQQTPLFSTGETPFKSQEPQPERNLASKYRAFPDAYLTKEKEHGKLNPRPGKVYIFDQPGMCGQRFEVRSDVIDASPWELQETISIRVIRGGWVLYEKPNFKGEKIAVDEGDIEITCPFSPPEHQRNGREDGAQNGPDEQSNPESARKFIIGSIRRAVRDYSVPEISLFPEENAEGKKVVFRDTSEDARIFGLPIKANSIIVSAGLWLVYAHPSFQGTPRVLEVGGYSNPAAWGVDQPYVGSLHPLKIGEPRVETASEPKMVIYDKPYFTGKSRTITSNMRDFMTRTDCQQTTFMYSVGSLKVLGGIWVGYEKEGYRGHQYLLEEGEYHDWRVWGGCDSELRSVRVIRADLNDPLLVMFELPEDEGEGEHEGNTFEVTEAIPDVELFNYKSNTRSIHVLSGAWVAYSHVDFSGNQYILEKGFYNNCADWGSQDNRICSLQPILVAHGSQVLNEVILYSEAGFQGECQVFDDNQEAVSEKLLTKSCRVSGGSWVIYEEKNYSGSLYVLSEGDYPNLSSMGCPSSFTIGSVKAVAVTFTVPSISLFSLECLEGREITTQTEITSMVEEGFNNHILSVRVNSGCWVICEHSNYRGRQFFLEPIEITNWLKFSSLQTVGSLFPVRQKRRFFRIKNVERGQFMSVQGGVDEMKSGRVVVSAQVEPMSDIWYYQDGLVKNKLISTMSLQVMGNIEPGSKAILWSETRQPVQTWTTQMKGLINSVTFPGMVLDVKGGKTYDKDHVVIMPENEERPSQQWEIELL